MIKNGALSLLLCLLLSCRENDPCKLLNSAGVYSFPEPPKNSSLTREEIYRLRDLPEEISHCISTQGLLETCLTYPDLALIYAGTTPQTGYDLVSTVFRGVGELSDRPDRADVLLKKYRSVDPLGYDPGAPPATIGNHILRLSSLEIILSQYANLSAFNTGQKIELVTWARQVYQTKKKDVTNYKLFELAPTATVLARLMKIDRYSPFLQVYKAEEVQWNVVEQYWPAGQQSTELIYLLSEDYLTFLKQKK